MTETDLLNLAHSYNDSIASAFGQIITITFAMVIGIYYFLNQAKIGLRVFAYLIYSVGMFLYFGMMLASSNIIAGIHQALSAPAYKSLPTAYLLGVNKSWLGSVEAVLMTGGFWILWLSIAYLLFVWKKAKHIPSD